MDRESGGRIVMYLSKRWCNHGRHEWPSTDFFVLPGVKPPRKVCSRCYGIIMAAREKRK